MTLKHACFGIKKQRVFAPIKHKLKSKNNYLRWDTKWESEEVCEEKRYVVNAKLNQHLLTISLGTDINLLFF